MQRILKTKDVTIAIHCSEFNNYSNCKYNVTVANNGLCPPKFDKYGTVFNFRLKYTWI